MKNNKKHLDVNLDFLDQNVCLKTIQTGYQFNWKNILWYGVITATGLMMIIFSDYGNSNSLSSGSTTSYETVNSSVDKMDTGQYMCSKSNYDRAGVLEPNPSQETTLEAEANSLSLEGDKLSAEKDQLQNAHVDESNQRAINAHNTAIDDLNNRLASYRSRLAQHSQAIDDYETQVDVYNNFLSQNCKAH